MDNKRLITFVVLSFCIFTLWDNWVQHNAPKPVKLEQAINQDGVPQASAKAASSADPVKDSLTPASGEQIHIKTDMINAVINTQGGDLRRLELTQHHATHDKNKNFVLLDDSQLPKLVYISQTGLIGDDLPNHKSLYTTKASDYQLADGSDKLEVRLSWDGGKGVQVDKVYTFHRGSYIVDLDYQIKNGSSAKIEPWVYYQLLHDSTPAPKAMMQTQTFTGAAYYTDAGKYKKLSFDDMGKADLSQNAKDGWIGIVQHYFASAWIPQNGMEREYYTKHLDGTLYAVGAKLAVGSIAPGATANVAARLFSGPQEQTHLKAVAEGMDRTVDYGHLYVIAEPLFWILAEIQKLVHNWGAAIILLTILIKLAFFPLSAASYRSMAQMRKLAPRLQSMKERYGDDRAKLQQAMMELYKKEKINPMGGCLPILVQIPVFISLYWVLQGSIELRQAPFALWITDLSAPDPYYVLPIVMAATMILQTRLNPTPPDPIQAKVMMIMPVVFSVFFFFFPAGLVLYWLVNNVLSILQQWHINRTIDGGRAA
jgi:YidC/Oxa1 family membrane protein insertase